MKNEREMKNEKIMKIGLAVIGTIAVVACYKAYSTSKELSGLLGELDKLSDTVDVDIPDTMLQMSVHKAVDKAAKVAADQAVGEVRKDIARVVSKQVEETLEPITPIIQKKLESQITAFDISEIKRDVVTKTAEMVFENISIPNFLTNNNNTSSDSTADIVKHCVDNGMASWEIEGILKNLK